MPNRIIVSFRGPLAQTEDEGAAYLDRALQTKQRAEAHGATLCSWSAWSFAFAFDPDELEEALHLAALAFDVAVANGAPMGAGIAAGEMRAVGERGSVSGLAWGLPLVSAGALARAAAAGEVLIDVELYARRQAEIEAIGFLGEGDRIKRLVRGGRDSQSDLREVPVAHGSEPAPFVPDRLNIPGHRPVTLRPPADAATDTARRALLQGDVGALERLIEELTASGEHSELVERMSGFVALRRGATADALRRLRKAKEDVKEPAQRARALLAYAVALASAGRTESALLEALEALARARDAADLTGEHACALFLARLTSSAGHANAASVWARVASRAEGSQLG